MTDPSRIADPDFPDAGGHRTALGLVGLTDGAVTLVWVTALTDGAPMAGVQVRGAEPHLVALTDADGVAALPATARVYARRGADRTALDIPTVAAAEAIAWWTDPGPNVESGAVVPIAGVLRGAGGSVPDLRVYWSAEDEWGQVAAEGEATADAAGVVEVNVPVPVTVSGRLRVQLLVGGHQSTRTFDVGVPTGPGVALEVHGDEVVARVHGDVSEVGWTADPVAEDQPAPGWVGLHLPAADAPEPVEATTPTVDGVARLTLPAWDGPGTWHVTASAGTTDATLALSRSPSAQQPRPTPTDAACCEPLPMAVRPLGPGVVALVGRAPFVPSEALVTVAGADAPSAQRMTVTREAFGCRITLPSGPSATVRVDLVGRAPRHGADGTRPAWATATLVLRGASPALAVRIAPQTADLAAETTALLTVDVADAQGRPVADAAVVLVARDAVLPPEPQPSLRLPPVLEGAHGRAWIRPGHPGAPPVDLPPTAGGGGFGAALEAPPGPGRPGAVLRGTTDARGRAVLPWRVGSGAVAWTLRAVAAHPDGRVGTSATRVTLRDAHRSNHPHPAAYPKHDPGGSNEPT
ncbi:MAG: hypothetical protein ACI8PZ_006759 [Myxococcota bacterium]|jgi:hypothetical protein